MPGFAVATLKQARRLIVAVVGGSILLIGLALLVLPGPAFLVIPLGLAILATEFVWARRLLRRVKREASRLTASLRGGPGSARRT
ncbi:MAG: PGPGW domain-containing protein [candidate division NC10 bacterium]|nr:PGPGW domain-containing protein [candidate division NC10 bacterium]